MTKSTLLELILLTHFKPRRVDFCQGVELIWLYPIYRNSSANQNKGLPRVVTLRDASCRVKCYGSTAYSKWFHYWSKLNRYSGLIIGNQVTMTMTMTALNLQPEPYSVICPYSCILFAVYLTNVFRVYRLQGSILTPMKNIEIKTAK
jgi:hypothetical protein